MSDAQVFVYGEIAGDNIIQIPEPPDIEKNTFVLSDRYMIGGMATNVAVLLANWHVRTAVSGFALGDDFFGRMMLELLQAYPDLDLAHVEIMPGIQSAFCRILVTPNGDRYILVFNSVEREAHFTALTPPMLGRATHFVTDSLGIKPARIPALKLAHERGLYVIAGDINALDCPALPYVNLVCDSAGLLRNQNGILDSQSFARQLHQVSGAAVVITHGAHPVQVIQPDGEEFWVHPLQEVRIVDTTGAGDALKAGVTYGLAQGWSLAEAVKFGVGASSLIIEDVGAITRQPSVAEVMERVANVEVTKNE